jgi:regulator of sigma E protease
MTLLATIIVLGVLIFVHELGHFWAAKLVGVEVQRFSIGLGPRIWGMRWGETEYVLSAIPLGGYVKMGGMGDEVLEKVEGGEASGPTVPDSRAFDKKPIWARTLVISAGVVMNMVFAFVLYSVVAGFWGMPEFATTRVGQVYPEHLPRGAEALADIPRGAHVVRVGGRGVQSWGDVSRGLSEAQPGPLSVEFRDPAGRVEVVVPEGEEDRQRMAASLAPWMDAAVGMVIPGSPADRGGVEAGDLILSVDGIELLNWFDFLQAIRSRPGARVELGILREDRNLTRAVTLDANEVTDPITGERVLEGQVGIQAPPSELVYSSLTLTESVTAGYRQTVAITGFILGFLRDLFTGNVSPRSVGSIVTIGELSGQAAAMGLDSFLSFMALFSINLAILNLLPIPVLDGGHLLFLAIEALRGGRPLSVEQRLRWSQVGFVVLIGIMVWALSNDFMRLFGF